jgi:hypothetical protein
MSTMTATLHSNDKVDAKVEVQSQRAYPPFIAYLDTLYQCRNVASASGDYDLVGRVTIITKEAE